MLGSTHATSVVCTKQAELFSLSRASLVAIMQNYPNYQAELGLSVDKLELLSQRPPVYAPLHFTRLWCIALVHSSSHAMLSQPSFKCRPRQNGFCKRNTRDLWLLAYDLARRDIMASHLMGKFTQVLWDHVAMVCRFLLELCISTKSSV